MAENANIQNGTPDFGGNFNNGSISAVEVSLMKRRMDGAFDRMTKLGKDRTALAEKIKEKGVYKEAAKDKSNKQFVPYTQAEMIGFRAASTKLTSDWGDAKIQYTLRKHEYTSAIAHNTRRRKNSTDLAKKEAQYVIMQPQLIHDVNSALYTAMKNGHREGVEEMILFVKLRKQKEFHITFDELLPKISPDLFIEISEVKKVKSEVVKASFSFLKQFVIKDDEVTEAAQQESVEEQI